MTKHINIDTPINSELEDIFNSYIRVDMAERIDCESAIEEIAKLIKNQIIEARIDELNALFDETDGGYPDGCEVVHEHTITDRIDELIKDN